MKTFALTLACLTLLAASTADAQVYHRSYASFPGYPAAPVYVANAHHASTAAESYAHGYADVIRAQGEYSVLASQSLMNLAEARRREVENRVAETEAYFRMREINRRHRYGDRATSSSEHCVGRQTRAAQTASQTKPGQFTMRDGHLVWPKALQDDAFESHRAEIEKIFESRASFGTVSESGRSRLTQASRAMESELRGRVWEYSPGDYMAAKRFLATMRFHVVNDAMVTGPTMASGWVQRDASEIGSSPRDGFQGREG